MQHEVDFLIIGAGMAGEAAAQAIRGARPEATVAILGAEADPPYDRPPLSKALWKDAAEESIWKPIEQARATLELGRRATALDRSAHVVTDDRGDRWRYGRLLLATGGTPRTLPFGDGFIYFRTFADYRRLREAARPGARIAVIGGGFIGSEIAAALTFAGCRTTMLFPEPSIGARAYPAALAASVTDYYRDKGVEVRAGVTATGSRVAGNET